MLIAIEPIYRSPSGGAGLSGSQGELSRSALDAQWRLPYLPSTKNANEPHGFVVNHKVCKPSLGAVLLGLIPFIAMCFSVSLWDRMYPMVLGLPFNLFWLTSWILLTPLCMWGAYAVETRQKSAGRAARTGEPEGAGGANK